MSTTKQNEFFLGGEERLESVNTLLNQFEAIGGQGLKKAAPCSFV